MCGYLDAIVSSRIGYIVDRIILTIERTLIRDIIDQQDSHSSTIVRSCDCPKPLLSSSVPLDKQLVREQRKGEHS